MASTVPKTGDTRMAIPLPLLFADGQPTSLERISQSQLEKFIPFMLACCPEHYTDGPPKWWPSTATYQIPLVPSGTPFQWLSTLKQIVCQCYEYHKCEHVLRFCARLAELPATNLRYKECASGYISIYSMVNNKLIVTFKKKNQVYDRPMASPFKSLLPRKPSQAPQRDQHIEDIYLCNYCDSEFTSGKDAIAHEAACKGKVDEDAQNSETLNQDVVMRYFGLCPSGASVKSPGASLSKRGTSVRLMARSYMQIPVSSPLGLKMGVNVPTLSEEDKAEYLQKLEAYSGATDCSDTSQTKRPRKFGGTLRFKKHQNRWSHTYCFNKSQRHERLLTLSTGLNKQARLLLRKCKPAVVLVERLALLDPLALHAAACLNFANIVKDVPDKSTSTFDPGSKGTDTNSDTEMNIASNNRTPQTSRAVNNQDVSGSNNEATVCIDLTSDNSSDDEVSLNENCSYDRNSSDIFFHSSSNHKRLPRHDWSSAQGLRKNSEQVGASFPGFSSLPTSSLLPIASL